MFLVAFCSRTNRSLLREPFFFFFDLFVLFFFFSVTLASNFSHFLVDAILNRESFYFVFCFLFFSGPDGF
ncbi:hypothetical protein I7I50_02666 [Histoplasma capsulatum G186AR]|uniref:Uncharacterized protein n=1 Tax=Ajellomyces capsulatus TaxID=5037 RepID=A0A8H8D5R4_AJECA|nr:hypothetical protein I7I52_00668 [Histoplasma capsulatum]QSS71715.1 hypothetical protein I7I50_02666 [Histoplasma capsulatum G186AR]